MTSMAAASDPAGHHDWFSSSYVDRWIERNAVAGSRRIVVEALVAQLELPPGEACHVLDVGGGWGPVTRCLLDRHPTVRVVLQDFSEPMLERAAEHLAADLHRVRFIKADLREPSWLRALDDSFDGVVSSLAIHNVRDARVIKRVYRDLYRVMRPGSVLADFDLLDGHSVTGRQNWLVQAGYEGVAVDTAIGGPGTALFRAQRR